ncbi:aldehyde dehydrogenase family protein [Agarilytica rhodophyticola]|uniref:aldehyde dehydrogenase family protein n=1 Tax=Agarilytica rhodophyticola TaxID=1737490 RepID=UPI000B342BEA|nr:aldehyde dehydrogenase family protein [Agarilytica rhodophyticola]
MSMIDIVSSIPLEQKPTIKTFLAGSLIFNAGENTTSFLLVRSGTIKQVISRIEDSSECFSTLANEFTYTINNAGNYIDFDSFFSKKKRMCCSYANDNVEAWVFDDEYFDFLESKYPSTLLKINKQLMKCLASKQYFLSCEKVSFLSQKNPTLAIDETVKKSQMALAPLLMKTDKELDAVIRDMSSIVAKNLEFFANEEARQTGIGNSFHKQHKLSLVCKHVSKNLYGLKTLGRLEDNNDPNVVEYGSPLGVIFAIIPSTNPIPNSLFQSLHAVKTRNTLIVSYPKKAVNIGEKFVNMMREVFSKHSIPQDILQVVPQPSSRSSVHRFMSHPSVDRVLATGGEGLVKSAFSSGTPCLGVGPGNAPTLVYEDANLTKAAEMIIESKAYDNGIICGSENNIIVVNSVYDEFCRALENMGAAVLNESEARTANHLFFDDNKKLKQSIIGLDAKRLAKQANISREYDIRVILIPAQTEDIWLAKEKLAPLLSIFSVSKKNIIDLAKDILTHGGAGHTASIFTNSGDNIDNFANHLFAGRLLVNTPATFGMMGVSTDLPLSFMLGSGSWGGNLTTDAVTWRDFINIKRLAHHTNDIDVNIAENLLETEQ